MNVKHTLVMVGVCLAVTCDGDMRQRERARNVELPEPVLRGETSLEETLFERRSVRDYVSHPLTLAEVSQLLWAAQGITDDGGGRTVPSAGALYPLELYVAVGSVEDLSPGVYRYRPEGHTLVELQSGDVRGDLALAALEQEYVAEGAVVLALAAAYQRTTAKYGARGKRYVHMEVGHAAQNVYLQAGALGLGTVMVGAFEDARVHRILGLPADEQPLALMPVGRRR